MPAGDAVTPTETDVLAAQLLELDRCCRRQGRPAPGEAGGAEGTAAQLARWEGRAVLVRPGRRRSPPPAAGMVLLGTGPRVAHKKTPPRKGRANANLSAKDMARMRVLKSVLQGQIAELVILTKIGEDVTIAGAENKLDEIARLQSEEDLLLFLRYCDRPVHFTKMETVDSLIPKVVECLDWVPLKEVLGLGEKRPGKTGRRKSIFDDFVPESTNEEQPGLAPLPVATTKRIGSQCLWECFEQGIRTVAELSTKHAHDSRRPLDNRPTVPKPRGAVRTGKRGRTAFHQKRKAGDEKIRNVYGTAVDSELSSTTDISMSRRLTARPPPAGPLSARPPTGSSLSAQPPHSRGSTDIPSSQGRRRTTPLTENTGERLKFERMLRGEKKAAAQGLAAAAAHDDSEDDDSEEDEFDETPAKRAEPEPKPEPEPEPEPEPKPELEREPEPQLMKLQTSSKISMATQVSKASIASGLSTASTDSVFKRYNPEKVAARVRGVFDAYLQLADADAATATSTAETVLGPVSQTFGPTRKLYQTNVSPRAQPTTPRLRHSPLGATSDWSGHYDGQRCPNEDQAIRRRAPLPSAEKAPHVKTQHVWYRPYKRTPPYQSRWAVSSQYGVGAITGYDVAVKQSRDSGASHVRQVERDAEREAALAAATQSETVAQSARTAATDAAPVLPSISGAQSAR